MKILVIGSGGREHALAWKISKSNRVNKIYVAPGNAGMKNPLENVDIKADDIKSLLKFAKDKKIDLTVVGPEVPLTLGIVDEFEKAGLKAFGPRRNAAEIEGSKVFSRELLDKLKIAQPAFKVFTGPDSANEFISDKDTKFPLVIKADGLAAGKGVIIAMDRNEAIAAVNRIMIDRDFGDAGDRMIIEEFMEGKEVSFFVLTDGKTVIPLPTAQDYKRVGDGNKGPNTGGMGCYSPSAFLTTSQANLIMEEIIEPTLEGMESEGRRYKGFLYCGLMMTEEGPKVLEFNCRMGDPEAQVIIPRMESDIVNYFEAVVEEKLDSMDPIDVSEKSAVTVIMASKGYPAKADTGYEIKGVENAEALNDTVIFFAGVGEKDGQLVNSGGRVLAATASGETIDEARERAYEAVSKISFSGAHYRKDIAKDAI